MSEVISGVERITLSRERLRLAMLPKPSTPGDRRSLLERAKHWPAVGMVADSVDAWWENHPLHALSDVASDASDTVMRPLANRHPLALVAGAAVAGAVLAWVRPWRWLFSSALLAGLAPQLASRLVAKLPVESWISMLGSFIGPAEPRRRARRAQPTAAAPIDPTPPAPSRPVVAEPAFAAPEATVAQAPGPLL